jgi:hypothetical protein
MSKTTDNARFAGMLQDHLIEGGWYKGARDEWAGPSTQASWRKSIGLAAEPAPVVIPGPPVTYPADLPQPAATYRLPRETSAAMTAFYGAPSKSPTNLAWFSFPYDGVRLYSRKGSPIRDAVGNDGLPDHRCHEMLVGRFQTALQEIYITLGRAQFESEGWHCYGGFHNYRKKTGGSGLSTHAWGIAVDLNQDENSYNSRTTTFSDRGIDIMERWGFLSGFRAWGRDAMHFQAAVPNLSSGSYYARNGFPKNIIAVG